MKKTIHKIIWKARFNRTNQDIIFEVMEENCVVKKVTSPIARWMLEQPWVRCYGWLKRKYAEITSVEIPDTPIPIKNEMKYSQTERNPRRLNDREWRDRIYYTKG